MDKIKDGFDFMKIKCPNCGSLTTELIECDICHNVGCNRCVHRKSDKWLCYSCIKNPSYFTKREVSDLFSMFG